MYNVPLCINKGVFVDNPFVLSYYHTPTNYIINFTLYSVSQTQTGKAGELIDRGDNTYGGKFVINPSGGLISKGHPLGATGTPSL